MGQPGTAPLRSGVLSYCAAAEVSFAAAWGSLAGIHTTGTRRSPVRASAPAAHRTSPRAAGTVRLDATPTPMAHPSVEADTQLTAAAGEDPERPAAAVHHLARAS